jgi:hypothetical protein
MNQPQEAPKKSGKGCGLVVFGVIVVLAFVLAAVVMFSGNTKDDPALASSAQAVLAANSTVATFVDSVTATSDGHVIVTLNQTSAALSGTSGANGSEKIGAYINSLVLQQVSSAKQVATFDANNNIMEMSTRK